MDHFLLLIFATAVFEHTWCQNSTTSTTSTLQTTTKIPTLSTSTLQTTTKITTLSTSTLQTTTKITTLSTSTLQTTIQGSTTTAPLSTAMPTPSLVCENKGTLENGICLCPDDWTGTTCNISNFCPEQILKLTSKFTFPKTVLGQFASSVERCQSYTSNAGFPMASALCKRDTQFDIPNILDCGLTLDKINNEISGATPATIRSLASSTQILTSIPERLTANNITNAVKITSLLLGHPETAQKTVHIQP
ncbi:adhesion G-protein coupled receptor G7-like [Pseudorasbora parva]|uniref:adhesion G-protein coupled receptor G7-like n=1 Tax=Pseudorasbora parva TaxID=51549 RepID=UPI00351F24A1